MSSERSDSYHRRASAMTASVRERDVAIDSEDAPLAGRFYEAVGVPRSHLVLHPATGVPQRFYRSFAHWAAQRGIGVLTYDYRDFGASRRGPLRRSMTTFTDWIVPDQLAARRTLAELAPEGPLWMLGHSLGGLGFPFHPPQERLERIVTVGSGTGHFTDHPWSYRPKVIAFWFLLGPIATRIAGHLPGRRLLLGADLPAGVYWQWRRWCTSRDFYARDVGRCLPQPHYGAGPPVRMVSSTDDVVVPPVAVNRYADRFDAGRITSVLLDPDRAGVNALGHIDVFARRNEAVWADILAI